MRRYRNLEMPKRSGRTHLSGKALEREYLGSSGEKKSAKRSKTSAEAEREYIGSVEIPEKKKARVPGRIIAIRPDEQFITAKEANHYLSAKYEEMQHALEEALRDRDEMAALPENVRNKVFQEKLALITAEEGRLRLLAKEVDDILMSEEGREAVYEGSELLVENPYYNPQSEQLAEVEAGVDEEPDVDGLRGEVKELQAKWKQLTSQVNMVMMRLKGTSAMGEMKKRASLAAAKKLEEPVYYPQILEKDVDSANKRAEYLRQAQEFEEGVHAEKREKGYADQLHHLLTELDEVSEALEAKKMNLTFLEKKFGVDRAA